MARRKPKLPKSPPTKRRWLRYGIIIGLLVAVVIVYETGQQLRRQSAVTGEVAATNAADTPRRLKSYYRSHDLPANWEVGEIKRAAASGIVEVPVFFSPGPQSSRYGKTAEPSEINMHNACPTDESGLWGELADHRFDVLVNDKTGLIDRVTCTADTPTG